MDIKMTCALAIINACLGNDPSQVTERMNALRDISLFQEDTVKYPYTKIISTNYMLPQEYCKYALIPLRKVIRFEYGIPEKWATAFDMIHDTVNTQHSDPFYNTLFADVTFQLLRCNNDIQDFIKDKSVYNNRSKNTLEKLYKILPNVYPIDYNYKNFLHKIDTKGVEYAVLSHDHYSTICYIVRKLKMLEKSGH